MSRFTSLLGPTFPNRQYLYAAQSGGQKNDPGPLKPGMFTTKTVWDNLLAAKVPSAYYYTDLPILTLWVQLPPSRGTFVVVAASSTPGIALMDPSSCRWSSSSRSGGPLSDG